jgi:hypothetical protein
MDMSSNNRNRRRAGGVGVAVGAATGGLLAAAFLPMTVANADEFIYTPEPTTFVPDPSTEWGVPGVLSGATGTEDWSNVDVTTNTAVPGSLFGTDTETSALSLYPDDATFSNDLLSIPNNVTEPGGLAGGSVVDLFTATVANSTLWTGLPQVEAGVSTWGNELVDAAAGSVAPGITDTLITPFGDFALF